MPYRSLEPLSDRDCGSGCGRPSRLARSWRPTPGSVNDRLWKRQQAKGGIGHPHVHALTKEKLMRPSLVTLARAYVCRGCGTSVSYPGTFRKCPVCGIKWG